MQSPAEGTPVLYYLYARERVDVLSRSADGAWYRIRNEKGEEGWVHARLLPVPIDVARRVAPVSCGDGGEQGQEGQEQSPPE
ncbi:MAG: SH3 domain-containing protein [Chloroflexaceae bacterium]|nr:SH3 domain-containing protein [Chloroflexaceae bacterium]